eukprot:3407426-Alexandrium_andersonii.AAC.1
MADALLGKHGGQRAPELVCALAGGGIMTVEGCIARERIDVLRRVLGKVPEARALVDELVALHVKYGWSRLKLGPV